MSDYITLLELKAQGFTLSDVRTQCPWATERQALDGQPCWLISELAPLFERGTEAKGGTA